MDWSNNSSNYNCGRVCDQAQRYNESYSEGTTIDRGEGVIRQEEKHILIKEDFTLDFVTE